MEPCPAMVIRAHLMRIIILGNSLLTVDSWNTEVALRIVELGREESVPEHDGWRCSKWTSRFRYWMEPQAFKLHILVQIYHFVLPNEERLSSFLVHFPLHNSKANPGVVGFIAWHNLVSDQHLYRHLACAQRKFLIYFYLRPEYPNDMTLILIDENLKFLRTVVLTFSAANALSDSIRWIQSSMKRRKKYRWQKTTLRTSLTPSSSS